jgi:hypothetical protein
VLSLRDLPPFPLQPPITLIINAILNMDLAGCKEDVFPTSDPLYNVKRLVHILNKSIDAKYTKVKVSNFERFDENGAPIITLLRKIIEISSDDVKVYLKSRLLPSEEYVLPVAWCKISNAYSVLQGTKPALRERYYTCSSIATTLQLGFGTEY